MSDTNIYSLGQGAKIEPQKLLPENTNTTATREARPSEPPPAPKPQESYPRLRWEHQRALNHPPAMRRLFEENGRLQADNRILRQHHKWDREAQHARKFVGVYTGESQPMSDEEWRNYKAEMAILDAKRAERLKNHNVNMASSLPGN